MRQEAAKTQQLCKAVSGPFGLRVPWKSANETPALPRTYSLRGRGRSPPPALASSPLAVLEASFPFTQAWPQSLSPHAGKDAKGRQEAQGSGRGVSTGLGAWGSRGQTPALQPCGGCCSGLVPMTDQEPGQHVTSESNEGRDLPALGRNRRAEGPLPRRP